MKYNLSFTAGGLLHKESSVFLKEIKDLRSFIEGGEDVSYLSIPVNSESSKKRMKSELLKRFRELSPEYLARYMESGGKDQKAILFLAFCKIYKIMAEFCLEVVLPKFKAFNNDLKPYDFEYFLTGKLEEKTLDEISEKSRYKLSTVALKVLREVGLYKEGKIKKVELSVDLRKLILKNGDGWFLTCILND